MWLDQPLRHLVALSKFRERKHRSEEIEHKLAVGNQRVEAQLDKMRGSS